MTAWGETNRLREMTGWIWRRWENKQKEKMGGYSAYFSGFVCTFLYWAWPLEPDTLANCVKINLG